MPAAAQPCICRPGGYEEVGPAHLVVPQTSYVPHTRYVPETRLVPRTRYVPHTRLVPRTVNIPRADNEVRTRYSTYPVYPGTGYVVLGLPSLFDHPCYTGSIGCIRTFGPALLLLSGLRASKSIAARCGHTSAAPARDSARTPSDPSGVGVAPWAVWAHEDPTR